MRLVIAAIALWTLAGSADALEVWLASTQDCNSCALYQRAARLRGYGRALEYPDRGGLTIPILSIDKGALAPDVLSQLPEDLGPDSPYWGEQLLVLVMEAGRVITAGNIAESADNLELRQPEAVMFPPAAPADGDPALRDGQLYAEFFTANWNLEYFVDVALGKRPKRSARPAVDLESESPARLGASNVILWGSAGTPLENALFIPTRLGEIRTALEGLRLGALRIVTLYGNGPGVDANETSYLDGGRTLFKHVDVRADYAADADGLNAVLTGVRGAARARTLLVQVGHAGPTGSPLWGHGLTLQPADLEPLEREGADLIMVSGACNGGQYAKVVQCGFFAAHPDVLASGCQLSPEALEGSDDYLRHFFRAASGTAAASADGAPGTASATAARANGSTPRGRRTAARALPSLYEAHWYASTRLEDHALSYTTTDALIDDYFAAHPDRLPESLTVAEIRAAAQSMAPAERSAAEALTAGLAADLAIPLTGYVEANRAADAKLADARELTSAERNAMTAMPYKLVLVQLARRIAYTRLRADDPDFALASSCEQQTLPAFLTGR